MGSRIRIKTRNWRTTSASLSYLQLRHYKLYFPLKLTNSSPVDKVFNFIKINESLNWFETEMGSRIRIKTRKWRTTSASLSYLQLRHYKLYFPLKLTNSSPVDKVFNFIKINESLKWFETELGSRFRIKTRNWRTTSASLSYLQLRHYKLYFPLKLTNSSPVDKVFNFIKINESLNWFETEMGSRIRIKTRKWRTTSAS